MQTKQQVSEYNRQYRLKHHQKALEYNRQYYKKNKDEINKLRRLEKNNIPIPELERRRAVVRKWYAENRERLNKQKKEWKLKNPDKVRKYYEHDREKHKIRYHLKREKRWLKRLSVINRYGGICVCCKENNPRFLTFDHINNDGKLERKEKYNGEYYVYALKNNFPTNVQLLCFNCNYGKNFYKVCPHNVDQSKLESLDC